MIYDYIFDLDGTITVSKHRQHFVESSPKDWKSFNKAAEFDTPNHSVISVMNDLYHCGKNILILTGRSIEYREMTLNWLYKNDVPYNTIIMRPLNDNSPDTEYKKRMYESFSEEQKKKLICCFEDRSRVVVMWRNIGVSCFQVIDGEY